MKKFLFLVCFALAVLGCGGDDGDLPPLGWENDVSVYCRYNNRCEQISYEDCTYYYRGTNYGSDRYCGVYPSSSSYPISSSNKISSSSIWVSPSSSSLPPSSSSLAPSSSSLVPSSSSLSYIGRGNSIGSYRTVVIGTQTWMAENLDYVVEGSRCYGNNPTNCETYGSLYNWSTAMNLPSSCTSNSCSSQIQSPHRGICPVGWHIPSDADWNTLMDYVGGSSVAGTKLKSTSGWNSCGPSGSGSSYLCEDTFGFSALPGGYGDSDGSFLYVGYNGIWWSASEYGSGGAYIRYMYYYNDTASWVDNLKSYLFSVRCLQD